MLAIHRQETLFVFGIAVFVYTCETGYIPTIAWLWALQFNSVCSFDGVAQPAIGQPVNLINEEAHVNCEKEPRSGTWSKGASSTLTRTGQKDRKSNRVIGAMMQDSRPGGKQNPITLSLSLSRA
jgi:hypothetical protein